MTDALSAAVAGRRIALGVCGSVAAFKAPSLAGRLTAAGALVDVILTAGAEALVGPLTFQAMTHRPVVTSLWQPTGPMAMDHLEIAKEAAALVVAPATANTLARLALGLADDALTTTALAYAGPVVLAPAMEPQMWRNEAVQAHVATLTERHFVFVGPAAGRLASGAEGIGRMADLDDIAAALTDALGGGALHGRSIVVTAGPTREPIDPVRYLSNQSSGTLGYAIAADAARRGARVTLISGPVALDVPPGVDFVPADRALDMQRLVMATAPAADVLIMAAAIADFRPAEESAEKIAKSSMNSTLSLVANPDILAELSRALESRSTRPILVGFSAESYQAAARGSAKLAAKGLDLLVANLVPASFGTGTARAWLVSPEDPADTTAAAEARDLGEISKPELARIILDAVAELLAAKSGSVSGGADA